MLPISVLPQLDIDWFGQRGIYILPEHLSAWHWENNILWFVVSADDEELATEDGFVDVTYTHRENGTSIHCFELYESVPRSKSPLAQR